MIALLASRSFRLKVGGLALALTAGVVLGGGDEDLPAPKEAPAAQEATAPAAAAPRAAASPAVEVAAVSPTLALDRLRRAGPAASDVTDLFAGRSWAPPPPPAPPPAAAPPPAPVVAEPAKPVAPPLPFVYIGRLEEEGQPTVYYLERGAEVLTVGPGEAIGREYKFESAANGRLEFTYLPLETRQVLQIGDPQ